MREKTVFLRRKEGAGYRTALCLCFFLIICSETAHGAGGSGPAKALVFSSEQNLGRIDKNPSTPFLRYRPDGRLHAVWSEDHETSWPQERASTEPHRMSGDRAPSPMRNAVIASSDEVGKTWSGQRRVNSEVEAVQGEENGPKVAFDANNRAFVVWSIPGAKGDKTRANIRFAMEDGIGGFTEARTMNEIKDTARFPILESAPDGNLMLAWIDRRVDNPKPRQLYMMRLSPEGKALTNNYSVGQGLCECCKLGVTFANGGKTVYIVDRQVDDDQIRNHVLRKSIDGGKTFAAPVVISNDGWQVPSCPHSGPSIGRDSCGKLHVTWFTLGRSEKEAGIYYSVSNDDGESFAPRRLVHANTAPEILYSTLAVGSDDTVYLTWTNLDGDNRAQVFVRSLSADGRSWGPIQQLSNAKGNANRPVLAVSKNQLHVAWTETDGEESRVVLRNAMVAR
jgi:hypothetical protein